MTDCGFEPDRVRAWLVPSEDPAVQRMADVVLAAMTAAGGENANLALQVLTKVQAMVVAGMVRNASRDEVRSILLRAGPAVQNEAIRFLRSLRRDIRKAS